MVGLERGTVELEPYQDEWRSYYVDEVERLNVIAGDRFLDFAHIGSTALEGMPAKPLIDLLAVVEELEVAQHLIPVLEEHGYEHRPDGDVRGRLFFAKGPRSARSYHLSLTERESDYYAENIAFRDYLREHPDVASEYASLKERLAARYPESRETYTAKKGDFIQEVLARARDE